MESKLFLLSAAAAGLAAGWVLGRRNTPAPSAAVPDEERLAWLQRLSTVGQMMSGVVHEIRTPPNTVILAVEYAQEVLARKGDPSEQLATASREADRAVAILSDILDFGPLPSISRTWNSCPCSPEPSIPLRSASTSAAWRPPCAPPTASRSEPA